MNYLSKGCLGGLVFAMVLAMNVHSQQFRQPGTLGIGALGGVNLGGAVAQENISTEIRALPMFGGIAEFGVNRPLSLAVEPMYAVEGANFTIGDFEGTGEFGYLQVPVLIRGNLQVTQASRVFAFAGPNLAFNLNATGDLPNGAEFTREEVRPFSLLGDFGLGGSWGITRGWHLLGNLRYTYGFMDILEDIAPTIDSWEPRGIKAGVGVMYHLPG